MRVIVTRVQPQADSWVKQLVGRFDALALPLIVVSAARDVAAVQAAGKRWADYTAVMFVSSHAVQFFFEQNMALAQTAQAPSALITRAWATGPGTRAALLKQGLAATLVDSPATDAGQFDSEALWQSVRQQITPGARVLIVRGNSSAVNTGAGSDDADGTAGVGRDWLAQQLRQAGATVDFVVAYQRGAPVWSASQRALASAAASDGSVWLFSSAEAVQYLGALLPAQDWSDARALATHQRIAQAARWLGFGLVAQARPTLADVLVSLESLS
ncbi:MAG: uroporphyrinogen-III synthase [Rhodoferax sp.]|nr:uroporphyrinogen-III synthase [Rhodoferax sp.]